ncbi:MAG: CRISPR-associated protein Cas4, partial [Thermoplasmata archaeon]
MEPAESEVKGEDLPEYIPVRMLNEFVYCPRLAFLEFVECEWADSEDTLEGKRRHRRADRREGELPDADMVPEEERFHTASVRVSSARLGLYAVIDIVEGGEGKVFPVDYKKGRAPDIPDGAWKADRVQLCAQALILQDNGYKVEAGTIYYCGSKKRIEVKIDSEIVSLTLSYLEGFREMLKKGAVPEPLRDSSKCPGCSLNGICLPDEVAFLKGILKEEDDVRRLVPLRDDALPCYVREPYGSIGISGDVLEIKRGREVIGTVKLIEISQLCLMGQISVSPAALNALIAQGTPVCYFSYGGWFYAITTGMWHKNVLLRQEQYRNAADRGLSLKVARKFIEGKIKNCRTLLRRNMDYESDAVVQLNRLIEQLERCRNLNELLGVEGTAANIYFA